MTAPREGLRLSRTVCKGRLMMSTTSSFGPELRRLRVESGLTLTEFSVALNYDKGHLSKVERGERSASPELARRCDAFLGADGELHRLVTRPEADSDSGTAGPSRSLVGRRAVLSAGTGALIDLGLTLSGQTVSSTDAPSCPPSACSSTNCGNSARPPRPGSCCPSWRRRPA
ncbi:helix-turn-helix transcriptional regulator [Streptomyces cavourensis]